ncbi:50S ribosomal protein L18e [Candidatus Woesearchaeota archaeon]|nr:50S ribosomal protein L18e [Candidatus Woesearchaeota archaeon]
MKRIKNPRQQMLINELKKLSIEKQVPLWKRVAVDLEKPTRQQREINVYKIDKYAKENETVIVPGKVLGTGVLTKKVNVAAFNFSEEAYKKISSVGTAITINELMKKNPQGSKIRILG